MSKELRKAKEELIAVVKAYQDAWEQVNKNHLNFKVEVTKVGPMTMPSGLLFYLDRLTEPEE